MVNVFERGALAGRMAVEERDPSAALRAILMPDTLPPRLRWAVEKDIEKGGWNAAFMSVVRNPLTLLGVILAFGGKGWRLGNARQQIARLKQWRSLDGRVDLLTKKIGTVEQLLGQEITDDLYGLTGAISGWMTKWTGRVEGPIEALRRGGGLTRQFQIQLGRKLERADVAGSAFNRHMAASHYDPQSGQVILRGLPRAIRGQFAYARPIKFSPLEQRLYDVMAASRKELFQDVLAPLAKQPEAMEYIRVLTGRTGKDVPISLRELADYLPHQLSRRLGSPAWATPETTKTEADLLKMLGFKRGAAKRAVTGKGLFQRRQRMVPDPFESEGYEHLLTPDGLALRARHKALSGQIPYYSHQAVRVWSSYMHDMSRVAGFALKGEGQSAPWAQRMTHWLKVLEGRKDVQRKMWFTDMYLPLAMNKLPRAQIPNIASFVDKKTKAFGWLAEGPGRKLVPRALNRKLQDWLQESGSWTSISGKAAAWMYAGALGANPSSVAMNLLQNVIGTIPEIGPRAAWVGAGRTLSGAQKYFGLRATGTTARVAWEKAFPRFAASGLPGAPWASEAMYGHALDGIWAQTAGKTSTRVREALLLAFKGSELFNRISTYEGALWRAGQAGIRGAEATQYAANMVRTVQFAGGAMATPHGLQGVGPLSRQFLQFPMRYANFLWEGMRHPASGGPGRVGRAMLASGVTYEAAKAATGIDLSRGLMWGALPDPHPSAPFAPWPLVPPAWSLAGSAAMDIWRGTDRLKYQLPILIPGGVMAARLASYMPGKHGQAIGRRYADYTKPNERGEVPMFTDDGQLLGYYAKRDLVLMGLGLKPRTREEEREWVEYIGKQREVVRQMRRDVVEAEIDNDMPRAMGIRKEHRKMFGVDMTVKKSAYEAVRLRREVTRLERMTETLPVDVRQQYLEAMGTALISGGAEGLMGIDPALLRSPATPTIRKRRPQWGQAPMTSNPLRPQPGSGADLRALRPGLSPGPQPGRGEAAGFRGFASFAGFDY